MQHKNEIQDCLVFLSIWIASYASSNLIEQGDKILACIICAIASIAFFLMMYKIRKGKGRNLNGNSKQ